ncbi:hypothetical protein AQUCO_00500523v1 [Aquilegia coerulea]|uniref:Uncharacterized protein n=1 Tax=Aquilegia coerulea TaxID=218851 RepID=A0A2G5ESG5_AQUCA|nr:hypothetical protein AQUCO_00500523v1 [Aquilegia coerulea]
MPIRGMNILGVRSVVDRNSQLYIFAFLVSRKRCLKFVYHRSQKRKNSCTAPALKQKKALHLMVTRKVVVLSNHSSNRDWIRHSFKPYTGLMSYS